MSLLQGLVPLDALVVPRDRLFQIFQHPRLRPPIYDEMAQDIDRLVKSLATRYASTADVSLHFDELVSLGNNKVVALMNRGYLTNGKAPSRVKFFALLKASLSNMYKAHLKQVINTEKRTGVKAVKKRGATDEDYARLAEARRAAVVRIDDPDVHIQVADTYETEEAQAARLEGLRDIFTPAEWMVVQQIYRPNDVTLVYVYMESLRGSSDKIRCRITSELFAKGLGLSKETFEELRDSAMAKIQLVDDMPEEVNYLQSVAYLENLFSLQVPRVMALDKTVIKRLFTIAARDQFAKVYDREKGYKTEVVNHLAVVGAKVPELLGGQQACFGVLYEKNHRVCAACGRREACRVEAANFGLGDVSISPKLLGARAIRTAALVPRSNGSDEPQFESARDYDVWAYLCDNFDRTVIRDEHHFRHAESRSTDSTVIVVDSALRFRFVKPSDGLIEELDRARTGFYLPAGLSAQDAIELVQRHAEESLEEGDE